MNGLTLKWGPGGAAVVTIFLLLATLLTKASEPAVADQARLLLVVGAPGDSEFGSNFVRQASLWQNAASQAHWQVDTVGMADNSSTNDHDRLKQCLDAEPKEGMAPFWLVLIGHGTFSGHEASFNLRGPDVTATELAGWLKPFRRPLAAIDTSSSSGPFLARLAATNRVVITATRSGNEQNFARFGQYLAETITDPEADLDKDGSISLLEAFLAASRRTAEFYKSEGRIVTEHALLDDNGDGLGTPADWFRGLRAVKRPQEKAAVDGLYARQFRLISNETDLGLTAEQQTRRDALERAVLLFREKKAALPEEDYYRELEKLLLPLAQLYHKP